MRNNEHVIKRRRKYNKAPALATFCLTRWIGDDRLRGYLDAQDVRAALGEYEEWLKRTIESAEDGVTGEMLGNMSAADALDYARDRLFEIFNARGLSPWEGVGD